MKQIAVKLLSLLAICSTLPACILIGNKATEVDHRNIGAQLIDLKRAKDQGLLSESEYRTQHALILSHSCKSDCEKKQ